MVQSTSAARQSPPRSQRTIPIKTLDDVAAGLVHHAHSVVPGRRNRLVILAGRHERPGYPVNLRHVVPPELDERPEALGPAIATR